MATSNSEFSNDRDSQQSQLFDLELVEEDLEILEFEGEYERNNGKINGIFYRETPLEIAHRASTAASPSSASGSGISPGSTPSLFGPDSKEASLIGSDLEGDLGGSADSSHSGGVEPGWVFEGMWQQSDMTHGHRFEFRFPEGLETFTGFWDSGDRRGDWSGAHASDDTGAPVLLPIVDLGVVWKPEEELPEGWLMLERTIDGRSANINGAATVSRPEAFIAYRRSCVCPCFVSSPEWCF